MSQKVKQNETVTISISKGDIINSKKGMLQKSVLTKDKAWLVFKAEYLGDGNWMAITRKEVELL